MINNKTSSSIVSYLINSKYPPSVTGLDLIGITVTFLFVQFYIGFQFQIVFVQKFWLSFSEGRIFSHVRPVNEL